MRIHPNSKPATAADLQTTRTATGSQPTLGRDKLAFHNSEKLDGSLQQTPDVRTEKVARAKRLIADPAYPSPEILRGVSNHLAEQLEPPGAAE